MQYHKKLHIKVKIKNIRKRLGFTLIELLVVVTLITFISMLSFKLSNITQTLFVKAELEKIYAVCLYLQRRATLEHKSITLEFNKDKGTYSYNNFSYKLPRNIVFGANSSAKGPPSRPTKLIKDPITFKDHMIFFYSDGTISSGVIYLTNHTRTCLYALSSAVAQISHLRRYRYDRDHEQWKAL